ncbi:MAG: hypothetical protein OXG35_14415, partial [Acidobacteria bacterium]|nr:hypothetical protein [Acidobacteriota bacterium]
GMHNQVRQWTRGGVLASLLDTLFDRGFEVFLTSDHAPARRSFVRESERPVADGGVTLEEVVVPFVEIERSGSTIVAAAAGPENAVAPSVEVS